MSTKNSPIGKLRKEAARCAAGYKQICAAIEDDSCELKIGIVMDDKVLMISMMVGLVKETSEEGLATFILEAMLEIEPRAMH